MNSCRLLAVFLVYRAPGIGRGGVNSCTNRVIGPLASEGKCAGYDKQKFM